MRRFGWCALLFVASAVNAVAGSAGTIVLENDAKASISLSSCFSVLPACGYAPVTVNINNDSARPQTWTFLFQSPVHFFAASSSMSHAATLNVEAKSTRTFKLLVPLAFRTTEYVSPLNVIVTGPWTNASSTFQFPVGNRTGKPLSAFVAFSESLAATTEKQVQKELNTQKEDLNGTGFVPNELPDDWRALVGITGIWITREEIAGLSAGQRGAVRDWVMRGGSLFVCGTSEVPGPFRQAGLGQVTTVSEVPLNTFDMATSILYLKRTTLEEQLGQSYGSGWKAKSVVGPITMRAPVLISCMALFAIVVGPVNLFVFAGRTRRHRLFWTTPLISAAASVLLLGLVILQDGFGGTGLRVGLIYVAPDDKKDVLVQEQIARTGALLRSTFTVNDPCIIAPITLDNRPTAPKREYRNFGDRFAGEWFLSRTLQAHWIESITPTRADVVLVNEEEVHRQHGTPVIVSNIGVTLDHLYFRDEDGQTWAAKDVRTGQRVALAKESEIPELLPAEAGPRLKTLWERVAGSRGYFYATTGNAEPLFKTLPSIHWQKDRVIFVGPLSRSRTYL